MFRPKSPSNRRHFTEAARAAAIASRRRKQHSATPKDVLEVFIIRSTSISGQYAWEIRRFGGVVLSQSLESFSDPNEARTAGELVLKSIDTDRPAASPVQE